MLVPATHRCQADRRVPLWPLPAAAKRASDPTALSRAAIGARKCAARARSDAFGFRASVGRIDTRRHNL